jgi:hypothetical protein
MAVRDNERFLDLEELASDLVAQLTALKAETESYAIAEKALGEASAGLIRFAAELATLGERVAATADALREIGTPQIIAEQANLSTQLSRQETQIIELASEVNGAVSTSASSLNRSIIAQTERVTDLADRVDRMARHATESTSRINQSLESSRLGSELRLTELQTTMTERIGSVEAQISAIREANASGLSRIRTLILGSSIAIAALLIVVVIVLVLI